MKSDENKTGNQANERTSTYIVMALYNRLTAQCVLVESTVKNNDQENVRI